MDKLINGNHIKWLLIASGVVSLVNPSFALVGMAICYIGFMAFQQYMEHIKKPDLSNEVRKEMAELKSYVSQFTIQKVKQQNTENMRFF